MHFIDRIKHYLDFPADAGRQKELESIFAEELYPVHIKMGVVILFFEALMMVFSLLRGGPARNVRAQLYFCLYLLLFCVTLIFLVSTIALRHKVPHRAAAIQVRMSTGYAAFMCVWSCMLTLLDFYSGPNLNVYSYILMTTAAFCMLKPVHSILIYCSSFVFLNCMAFALQGNPIFFGARAHSFNILMNSFFLTTLTIVISITLYRYRVMTKHDRAAIRAINRQLNNLAMTDQLTRVGNRRFLDAQFYRLHQQPPTSDAPVVGMMLDIDFFKQYNDKLGHQAGDVCLRDLAQLMQDFVRPEDGFVVRYGGEEFFLFLPHCRDAFDKAEALRQSIAARRPPRSDLPSGPVTVSIGVAIEGDCRIIQQDAFLRHCDEALYAAKNSGRNRVCIYSHANVST